VTHGDCANFSREFGTILDVEDAISTSYTLEVSSPGLDRKLTKAAEFERFVGSRMKVMTRNPVNNNRYFEGRLEAFAKDADAGFERGEQEVAQEDGRGGSRTRAED
jgi:ribosome maturation factor RimP